MAENRTPRIPTEEEDEREISFLFPLCCSYMNYTWELDPALENNIKHAMEEARDFLRERAGNPAMTFRQGSNRNIFKICTWYFLENKRADFEQEYAGDLLTLRLREGYGCGA